MIVRNYAHPHGFIAGEDELQDLAEACETVTNHYQLQSARYREVFGDRSMRADFWDAKAKKFASLAKNLREILAED